MPIASEDDQLLADYYGTVTVSCAGFLAYDDVGVVMKGLEEFGDGFFAEIGELVLLHLHLGVGIADHIKGNLHGLRGSLKS